MSAIVKYLSVLLGLSAICVQFVPAASAASTARIVETQPSAGSTLSRSESFYVRIEYESDEPINLWARPYRNGEQVEQAMSNASSKFSGSGETLGWFALIEPGVVDEVRVIAGGGKPYREWELARQSVDLRWTTASPSARSSPAWVDELQAAETSRQREEAKRRASEPVSVGDSMLFFGFMLAVLALGLGGLIVPTYCVWKWSGGWKIAAVVPLAIVAVVVGRILIDTARDPTSHNLWPFEILIWCTVSLVGIGALWVARRMRDVAS
jgi:hypothetical protein